MSPREPRPRGDWPTIIGSTLAAAALAMAFVAWYFPRQPGGAKSDASAASAAAATESQPSVVNWLSQQTGLWLYFAYVAFLAGVPLLIRFTGRSVYGFSWLVLGGIAFEIATWDSMSGLGAFSSVFGLLVAFVIFCVWWFDRNVSGAAAQSLGFDVQVASTQAKARLSEDLVAEATKPPVLPPVAEFPVWKPAFEREAEAEAARIKRQAVREWTARNALRLPNDPSDPDQFK